VIGIIEGDEGTSKKRERNDRVVAIEIDNHSCGTANRKGRKQLRGTYRHRATSRLYDILKRRPDAGVQEAA
jgi:hypothetical protein